MTNEFGEPWRIDGPSAEPRIMQGDPKLWITICGGPGDDASVPTPEQMKRIVLCVNFLAGVPTELLQRIGEPSFVNGREAGSLLFKVPPLQSRPSIKMELE